jgi:hypothetical protein
MAKQQNTQEYQRYIGQFFPHLRLDITFTHSDLKDKKCSVERSVMDYYRMWIDSAAGVMLVKESHCYIDGHFATVFQITMENGKSEKTSETILNIVNGYVSVFGCAVLWEYIPLLSQLQTKPV